VRINEKQVDVLYVYIGIHKMMQTCSEGGLKYSFDFVDHVVEYRSIYFCLHLHSIGIIF
jgi:hypothetical protein